MNGWEVCVECGDRLLTSANSSKVQDHSSLKIRFMPKGGCQCGVFADEINTDCPACFPTQLRCNIHPPTIRDVA